MTQAVPIQPAPSPSVAQARALCRRLHADPKASPAALLQARAALVRAITTERQRWIPFLRQLQTEVSPCPLDPPRASPLKHPANGQAL